MSSIVFFEGVEGGGGVGNYTTEHNIEYDYIMGFGMVGGRRKLFG